MNSREQIPDSDLGTAEGRPTILFVVDNSATMLDALRNDPGRRKMSVVRDLIRIYIEETIGQADFGLIVFGGWDDGYGCEAVRTLVKPSDIDRECFLTKIADLPTPRGRTPSIMAVEEAAKELERSDSVYRTIVLISDGIDTCSDSDIENENERERKVIDRVRALLARIRDNT